MAIMNNKENVEKQYENGNNLSIRTSLHQKYSTNKQGFFPWLFSKYEFLPGCKVLELGCGNGAQWEGRINELPNTCDFILSDFSLGMIDVVKEKYGAYHNFSFQQVDIENIPFEDETFDVVIANHMLYHVPNIDQAIKEVKRVLKNGGKFYCATNGNGGLREFIHTVLKKFDPNTKAFSESFSFSLQNGKEILEKQFNFVERMDYIDSLSITKTKDLVQWIESNIAISDFNQENRDNLYQYLEEILIQHGSIDIDKEVGMFISIK